MASLRSLEQARVMRPGRGERKTGIRFLIPSRWGGALALAVLRKELNYLRPRNYKRAPDGGVERRFSKRLLNGDRAWP
jgi:hypothetical protein